MGSPKGGQGGSPRESPKGDRLVGVPADKDGAEAVMLTEGGDLLVIEGFDWPESGESSSGRSGGGGGQGGGKRGGQDGRGGGEQREAVGWELCVAPKSRVVRVGKDGGYPSHVHRAVEGDPSITKCTRRGNESALECKLPQGEGLELELGLRFDGRLTGLLDGCSFGYGGLVPLSISLRFF